MKKYLLFSILIILFVKLPAQVQEDVILLKPEIGYQYIYEFTESTYILTDDDQKQNRLIKSKTFDIKFDKLESENKEVLKVNVTRNTIEKPDEKPVGILDYRFPYFQEVSPYSTSPDFTETLLSRLTLKYNFDYETSKIELLNLEELLLNAREILREKCLTPGKIDNRITDFNELVIPQTTRQIQQIFQIEGTAFSKKDLDPKSFKVSVSVQKPWTKLIQKRWEKEPGLYSKEITYNVEKQFLKEFNTVEIDSLKYPARYENKKYYLRNIENDIQLKVAKVIPQNRFIISGKIENLKNKKITLAVLRSPFGTKLSEESVFLDENNSFQIETELNHPQLVYLQFGNTNLVDNRPMMAFYAEPGSRIHLEATGETFPWEVQFSGDFARASKLLYDLRKEYNIFNQRLDWSTISFFSSDLSYSNFTKAFNNMEDFSSRYENDMNEYVFDYVENETKAYLFNILVYYLSFKTFPSGNPVFNDIKQQDFSKMESILDTTNIYNFYNEYGIHSRQLAASYLNYFLNINRRVNNPRFPEFTTLAIVSSYAFYSELPHQVENSKNILASHPFYSVLADLLLREKMNVSTQPTQFESFTQQKADEYLQLMTRVCNDIEFLNSISEIINNQQNWNDEKYVPSTKFFDENAEPVYMSDFFGEKPTIFYITNDWAAGRYFWDELAKENPEINFVLVMEGSNIQEWLDYEKRAEPIAHQLFLVNEDQKLQDIFKSNYKHFILYDKNGIRIGFADDPVTAKGMAEQSLNPPKEQPDKSQLLLIIYVLGGILFLFIIGLIMWKWRVRQRFRKEEQRRRLRELELTAIRSQMNPHFLFNSLNSVQNLVQQNKGREAHLYLSDFAGLIRKVLQNSEKEEVSLTEELETVQQYLNLEKLRFNFDYSVHVEEGIDANNTMVPSMLLQPFAENAVIHGLQNKPDNRQLKIEVARQNSSVKITMQDNGIGRQAAKELSKQKNGKSSKLLKERLDILQQKQGEKYELNIIDLNGNTSGTRVEILVPEEK
ncbi:MAG: histidine kinase [Tangfeifania sp.]